MRPWPQKPSPLLPHGPHPAMCPPAVLDLQPSVLRYKGQYLPYQTASRPISRNPAPAVRLSFISSFPTGLRSSCPFLCTTPLAGTWSMSCTVTGRYPKRLRPPFPARLSRPSLPRNCTMALLITPRGSRLFLDPRLNECLVSPLSFRLARLIALVSLLHWPPWILSRKL